ncbi:MAG: DUF2934 domain-containing protein [Nitrospiria bacterium]
MKTAMEKIQGGTTDVPTTRSVEFCIADPSLYERTARRAYELYQQRGEVHGYDVKDWLEAERQIVAQLEVTAEAAAKPPRRRATTAIPQLLPHAKP